MHSSFLVTLVLSGFSVALLHAAIPTHWLPFVMIGRTRGWSRRQIFCAVMIAGGGHIVATTLLGIAVARFGVELNETFEEVFHWGVAALLIALGLWLAFRAPHGRACDHCHGREKLIPEATDRAALWGLFLTLTLSPCELFLPIYLTAAPYGWIGITSLSLVLAVATFGGMMALTWVALAGAERLRPRWMARLDQRHVGAALCALGVATVAFRH